MTTTPTITLRSIIFGFEMAEEREHTMTTRTYDVPEISCDHCKVAIEGEVSLVDGVSSVLVTVAARTVLVEGTADDDAVRAAIEAAGYGISGSRTV
jgi:copper chaperone CopZ